MPRRVRRTRTKGGGMPAGAVYVGRGTDWGNPFKVKRVDGQWAVVWGEHDRCRIYQATERGARQGAVNLYRAYLRNTGHQPGAIRDAGGAFLVVRAREELVGKDLACWCPLDQPCHADVLLELANNPEAKP